MMFTVFTLAVLIDLRGAKCQIGSEVCASLSWLPESARDRSARSGDRDWSTLPLGRARWRIATGADRRSPGRMRLWRQQPTCWLGPTPFISPVTG